jgi:hypothetical protein
MAESREKNSPVSFAETAMRLGGKTEEEAKRTGAVDRADDQVEALFAPSYKTVNSPVHRAVWDNIAPLELFSPPKLEQSALDLPVVHESLKVLRAHKDKGTIYDEQGKIASAVFADLARAGYWGARIEKNMAGRV